MVSGHTQVVDAAFVEANASLDTFKRKAVLAWQLLKGEAKKIDSADASELKPPFTAIEKIAKPTKKGRNNTTHQSLTDTDARINQKPGKPSRLYYLSTMAVDTSHVLRHPFIMSLLIYKQIWQMNGILAI